jgi:4-amino-4-deoxychorismate lyase
VIPSATGQTWLDGQVADAALATNRAFAYGDGVFRTVLKHAGRVVDLPQQLVRLAADATRLHLTFREEELSRYQEEIAAVASRLPDAAVLKLIVARRESGRGYQPASDAVARYITAHALPRYPFAFWTEGIVAERAAFSLAAQPLLGGIKHLNRLEQVLGYRRASGNADEILFADAAGRVVCGGRSNLFWVQQGVLRTPELRLCGVAGHMRSRVLEVADRVGLQCISGSPTWIELIAADEVFLTNSLIGLWPLHRFEDRQWTPGPLTQCIAAALNHPCIGMVD